jgi:hypothetical protein
MIYESPEAVRALPVERVFVTWTQEWDLETYVAHYVRTRRLAQPLEALERVRRCIAAYPGRAPYTKSDLDFFLDANLARR